MDMDTKKMRSTSFPLDALEQAENVKTGWGKVGEKLLVPNLTVANFENKLEEAQQYVEKAEELKIQRATAIQERNIVLSELWDLTKRIRNAAKATFGDYSEEHDLLVNYTRRQD